MGVLDKFSLSEKTILVTGATGHLGREMVWALAEAGGHVLVNSRSKDGCQVLVDDLKRAGFSAENASFDILDEICLSEFFKGRNGLELHCLINNAYAGGAGTIETSNSEEYKQSYEMSVIAVHNLVQKALPALRNAVTMYGDASVVNVASMYGLVSPNLRVYRSAEASNPPFYGSAKAALLQWTRYAACEFGPEGIRFNAVSPGPFPSATVQQASPDFVSRLAKRVPMGRVGDAHEIQGAILLLASSASTFINGANLSVDGGWTIW